MRLFFIVDYKGAKVSKAYAINGEEAFEPFINLYPEGSVVSTAADMSRYMKWLMDGSDKVLNIKAKHELFQQHFTMSNEFEGMGYVWSRQNQNGVYYYHRKGETINFYSRIVIYPELNTGVFISFNTYVNEEKLDAMMEEITNLLLGHREQKRAYTGEQTEDISGYYISTRSNFTSQEKILNFITPNSVFHITGSTGNGFLMNGTRLLPIGKNYYSTPLGDLKYIEDSGRVYLANKTAISFVRTKWYESSLVQILIVLMSFALSLILTIIGAIALFRRKGSMRHYFPAVLSAFHIALFIGICILTISGASNFNMLKLAPFVRICGILIAVTSLSGILYTLYSLKKKIFTAQNTLLIAWNISSILFYLWMLQVNIL